MTKSVTYLNGHGKIETNKQTKKQTTSRVAIEVKDAA